MRKLLQNQNQNPQPTDPNRLRDMQKRAKNSSRNKNKQKREQKQSKKESKNKKEPKFQKLNSNQGKLNQAVTQLKPNLVILIIA